MESSPPFSDAGLAQIVEEYRLTGNIGTLIDRVRALAAQTRPEQLARATQPYRDMPEGIIPAYERLVTARPHRAPAMAVLPNAHWLSGRGPDAVGTLAARAKGAGSANRGAWHVWPL